MVTAARHWIAILGCALFAMSGAPAEAKTDGQERVVERARLALDSFLDDPTFDYMRVYVQNAYAVLVVPEMLKGGLFFGAEYGVGVRTPPARERAALPARRDRRDGHARRPARRGRDVDPLRRFDHFLFADPGVAQSYIGGNVA